MAAARTFAVLLATLFCAAPMAAVLAQSTPVWEPGDPLPDMGPDSVPAVVDKPPVPPPSRPVRTSQTTAPDAAPDDPEDFLCGRALQGTTAAVPPPFDRWLVRVCAPQGQALVPVSGEAWVAHGSSDPVSILALVPGATPPGGAALDARYDIRFSEFAGAEAKAARRERATALLMAALPDSEKPPPHDAVWQLDAQSNIALPGQTAGARYNLFFYVADGRPKQIIACLDECRQALYLDVLSGAEAEDALRR